MDRQDNAIVMQLSPGALLGPYRIERQLGRGGMAEVYSARDTRLGRTVAIKLLRREFAEQRDFRHRFEREGRAISALNHPHVCSLYDIGEQQGLVYLVMERVEGETLTQVLAKGLLSIERTLDYAIEIAEALRAAHEQGIVHRDLKPSSIMIAENGIKVLDFGLAKLTEHAEPTDTEITLTATEATRAGQIVGTVAYMSPEQAEGKPVGASSDLFSFGVVLYEMVCGRRPFRGETQISTIASILRARPETPRQVRHDIPMELEQIVVRCLEKTPEARYSSANDTYQALKACRDKVRGTRKILWRRPLVIAAMLAMVLAAATLAIRWSIHARRTRWAEEEALPQVMRLITQSHPLMALQLLRKAEPYASSSADFVRLKDRLSLATAPVQTTPPGAEIYVAEYAANRKDGASAWVFLGQSPLKTVGVPSGYYRFRIVKKGFETLELASFVVSRGLTFQLHSTEDTPAGMVWVSGTTHTDTYPALSVVDIPPFWIDKFEVTNREFKKFVDRGGYRNRQYWKQPFLKDGKLRSWEQAVAEFQDAMGRTGPATWELGTYPEGAADYPVNGVSWYEAAANAEFAGKSLTTVYHWYVAAGGSYQPEILRLSNFAGKGLAPVGFYRGVGESGAFDIAGNVKEWCWNPAGERRYILGGAWNEPSYQFRTPDARRPFERNAAFGFRCARYISPPGPALTGEVRFVSRDRRSERPAHDQAFRIYQSLHAYDKTDLNSKVESTDQSPPYWRKEDVTYQAAYSGERVIAHLFLPKNAPPSYQAVLFWGGANLLVLRGIDDVAINAFEFLIRSGRAVVVPAYKGTLERGPGDYYHLFGQPNLWREMNLQQSKDLCRSIDYLETRTDIDTHRLAYFGSSYGAAMAPHLVAVEPRIRAVVMVSGGSFEKVPPEVDSWNFAPRVKAPVLMDRYLYWTRRP
jgi:formylglycine-generating enzyme required for sulfatase activity/tRNA A-37 threonylcarbamoyl transferase component Bud32/dienelactone hydrolase